MKDGVYSVHWFRTFGPHNVYVELQRHRIREQEVRNEAAVSLSREFHLPVLATNGVNMRRL